MPTFSPDSLLAARFHNARSGLELVAIVDAALPVAMVTADVLAQDRKPLPLLEEFVLRLVGADVATEEAITGFLGLQKSMVTQTIADHFSADYLTYIATPLGEIPAQPRLRLTNRGSQTARDLASISPVNVSLPLVYDQLLCKVQPYDYNMLIPRQQAEKENLLLLGPVHKEPVETTDISVSEINSLLRDRGNVGREVLLVKRISQKKTRRVMPAKILIYADPDHSDIQLAVAVDGEISDTHEIALLGQGGAAALGIKVEPPQQRPTLEPELERVRVPLTEITRRATEEAAVQLDRNPAALIAPASEPLQDEVRAISVFEHPDLLNEAITQATRRILLISPWVKLSIVKTDFLSKLEGRLRRGVTVHIAHGIGDDDSGSDSEALRRLSNLSSRYPDKFTFVRLKSTHAKILIFDDIWISTSFNWLSFRGSRDRTYRMEEGTLVRSKEKTDEHYNRYLVQIDQDRQ